MAGVIDRDLGYKAFQKRVENMTASKAYVRVGVFSGEGYRDESGKRVKADRRGHAERTAAPVQGPASQISNVDLAVIHEFGAPAAGIPERSWLRSAFDKNREAWARVGEKLTGRIVDGKLGMEQALGLLGAKASADIKKGITTGDGIPPPNKPGTIAHKGSSRPLVDTGQLVNAITWDVGGEWEE